MTAAIVTVDSSTVSMDVSPITAALDSAATPTASDSALQGSAPPPSTHETSSYSLPAVSSVTSGQSAVASSSTGPSDTTVNPSDPAAVPLTSSTSISAPPPTVVYSCPCCCPCDECVAARSACTDPNCQTCRPNYTQHSTQPPNDTLPNSPAAATATATAATDPQLHSSHQSQSHQNAGTAAAASVPSSPASTTPYTAAASSTSPTLATAVVTAPSSAATAAAPISTATSSSPSATVALPSPSFSYSTPIPVTSASWINAPVTASPTTATNTTTTATTSAASTVPCSLSCCSPSSATGSTTSAAAAAQVAAPTASSVPSPPSTPSASASASSPSPLSISVTTSLPTPSDDKLATFSALLYRCLTNRAALQRMFDCGCLEHFISEQTSRMNGEKKPTLTVNTSAAALSQKPISSPMSVNGDDESSKGRKRKVGGAAAGSPKSAKKVKAERPPKASPSPSAAKRGRRPNRAGAASPAPSEPNLTPCSSPTALSSVPALVRSTTMPVESGATGASTMPAFSADAAAVVSVQQVVTPSAASFVAPLPSPKASTASPRRTNVKAARRSTPKGDKSTAGSSPSSTAIKRGPAKASIASAPNTPMSSRVLDLSAHRPQAAAQRAVTATSGRAAQRVADGYSPVSSHSSISSISATSTVYTTSSGESALSPSLHFSSHHNDSLLPALSLPSAYPEVAIQGVMEDVSHTAADVDEYRSYSRPRQLKAELVDDIMPQSGVYRYRPRTLSESHPLHPLHAINDSSASFQHDFLVHDATTAVLSLDGDNQQPLSPSSSSYHSGADSMDTEHSSPIPELERDAEVAGSASSSVVSSTRSNASSSSGSSGGDNSSWALNLDMDAMQLPLSIELSAS